MHTFLKPFGMRSRGPVLLIAGGLLAVAGAADAFAASRYVDDTGVNAGACTSQGAPCLTIQYAVTQAGAGDIIEVAAGLYAVGAVIDTPGLTVTGAGIGQTQVGTTTALPRAFDLRGSADGVAIKHLTMFGPYTGAGGITDRSGVHVNATAGLDVADLVLEDLQMTGFKYAIDVRYPGSATRWSLDGVDTRINEYGARFTGATRDLHVVRSHFDFANFGLYVGHTNTTPRTPGVFEDVEIGDSSFDGNATKGIYLEHGADLNLHGLSVTTPPPPSPRADVNPNNGIDVNLKYGAYANIRIADSVFSGATEAGVLVHGRNDAPLYNGVPGSIDNVDLEGLTVTGNSSAPVNSWGGVLFDNAVTAASLTRSRIVDNGTGGAYSDVDPGLAAGVDATDNWWGCNEGPTSDGSTDCSNAFAGPASGGLDADPWLVLSVSASPPAIATGGATAAISAGLLTNSAGAAAAAVPDGPAVAFGTDLGSISPFGAQLEAGSASAVLTSGSTAGFAHVTASLDDEQHAADVELVDPPLSTGAPVLSGADEVGSLLSCSPGMWTGVDLTFSWAWRRDLSVIDGRSGASAATTADDVGHAIACTVTATNSVGVTREQTSNAITVMPPPPVHEQPNGTSTGVAADAQTMNVTLAAGDAITLLDGDGAPATTVEVAGAGQYSIEVADGIATIIFVPVAGFAGETIVVFRVTDSRGRDATGTFTVTVAPPASPAPVTPAPVTPAPVAPETSSPQAGPPAAPPTKVRGRVHAPRRIVLRGERRSKSVACIVVAARRITRCDVTLVARRDGRKVVVGRGHASASGKSGRLTVPVRITRVGRALADRAGGLGVRIDARIRTSDGVVSATARAGLVARTVQVRTPVYFESDSVALGSAERRHLTRLRAGLRGVRRIECTGHTDSRSSGGYNGTLGIERARTVCAFLAGPLGIRTVLLTRGEARPFASNLSARGLQLNRRTEIRLTY